MAKIVTPAIRKIYKNLIKQVIADLSKPVTIFSKPDEADCPNCHIDLINNKSSGVFDSSFVTPVVIFDNTINPTSFTRGRCPICFGAGKLFSENKRPIRALVKWNPDSKEDLQILPVGREGIDYVRIKAARADYNLIKESQYLLIDGVRCELIRSPTIRALGEQEELVVAYLEAIEVGKDVKR